MKKGVNQVRQAISRRNKIRRLRAKSSEDTSMKEQPLIHALPQEEEKHGVYPVFHDHVNDAKQTKKRPNRLLLKGVLSFGLFCVIALLSQTNNSAFLAPQNWMNEALTEEFPFARMNEWYQTTFGSPLGFSDKEILETTKADALAIPVNGDVMETFQTNGEGIKVAPTSRSSVTAWQDGVVIFAGNDRETKKTVVIQHADGSKSTYAFLTTIDVHLYESVTGNEAIGKYNPDKSSDNVYFSIEKDNEFIDPTQVITVDDPA